MVIRVFVGSLLVLAGIVYFAGTDRIGHPSPIDDPYTVRGYASYDTFGRGASYSYSFTLTVSNHCWAMEVLPVQAPGIGERQFFDGVNLVALQYYDTNRIDRAKVSKWTDGYVRIGGAGIAEDLTIVAPTIWVGYASQFYLPSGSNGLLRPFWHPERAVRTKAFVPARWRLLSAESDLPDFIDFFYDAAGWDAALGRGQRESTSTNHTGPSIPVAMYQSFGRTNLNGRIFPLACTLTGLAAEREYQTGERVPVYKIELTNVTVRSMVEDRLFDAVFRGIAVVEDFREQRETPLSYEITNSAPPRLSDERRQAAARQEWQLQLAMKRKEMLAKDWTFRAAGRRFGIRVFQPFDDKGGRRYAVVLGRFEFSFGDDRARTRDRQGVSLWVPSLVVLVVAGLVIGLLKKRSAKVRNATILNGSSDTR